MRVTNLNIRYIFILPMVAFTAFIIGACASSQQGNRVEEGSRMYGFTLMDSEFERLWDRRTITIPGGMGGQQSMSPLFGSGAQARGGGPFEIRVRATIMDTSLLNAGIDQFATLAEMSESEKREFANRYGQDRPIDQYIYVYAQITTPYADSYLDIDRWTFYLMDEDDMKYEPKQTISHDLYLEHGDSVFVKQEGLNPRVPYWLSEPNPYRDVEFYFPLNDPEGNPILTADELTFGVVMNSDLDHRAEGSWDLEMISR